MDRGRKRKAGEGEGGGSASKRQKFAGETAEHTTEVGLKLIAQLKDAKDKTGRGISDLFLELPDRGQLPDYYLAIRLPVAIDTVEAKLRRHDYPTLTTVESDLKRMVHNAKQYNDDKSVVYGDAERIRKLLSNYMRVHNPAYQTDPNYQSFPTPLPEEDSAPTVPAATPDAAPAVAAAVAATEPSERPRKTTITLSASSRARKESIAPSASTPGVATAPAPAPTPTTATSSSDFAGKTFQQAQEQIVSELIRHTDDEGLEIYFPFVNLPARSLTDYYKTIKNPVSLKGVRKRTIGQHGREPPSLTSDFKTWDAFEEEVSFIWDNCRIYNEDGSDMYNLAGEFETHFKQKLAAAKAQVEGPPQPRIKLNARPKPVLHLGSKASPAPSPVPAVAVDDKTGINGKATPQPHVPSSLSRSTSQVPLAAEAAEASSPLPAVKSEKPIAPPPGLAITRLPSAGPDSIQPQPPSSAMPPPARLPSNSPHPATLPLPSAVLPPPTAPPTFIDTFGRTKPAAEALLPNLRLSTHPQLGLPAPLHLDIAPSPAYTQQSLTLALPPSHYYLQLTPTVSRALQGGRQYKLFVTVNGVRVMPSIKAAGPAVIGDMVNGGGGMMAAERKQVYDTALNVGVNRIEVEIVAATGRGGALETEKLALFVHLVRAL